MTACGVLDGILGQEKGVRETPGNCKGHMTFVSSNMQRRFLNSSTHPVASPGKGLRGSYTTTTLKCVIACGPAGSGRVQSNPELSDPGPQA